MAKNNKKKPKNETKNVAQKKVNLKKFIPLALIIALAIAGFVFLKNSPYFILKKINIIDRHAAASLDKTEFSRLYIGRNIFDIDINGIASRIKTTYPAIKNAVVKRILPDKLEINIISRVPVAKIKKDKYFPVDNSGMILQPETKCSKLPVILGLAFWVRPRPGEILESKELRNALSLIGALKDSAISMNYDVTTIDISNYRNIYFYLEDGLEVRIGGDEFPERLKRLKDILKNPNLDRSTVKYIDVRFKDVVIGPK